MKQQENEFQRLLDTFYEFEREQDLFSLTCDDVAVWERIRLSCFRHIMSEAGLFNRGKSQIDQDSLLNHLKGGYKWARGLVWKNPYFASPADILFIGTGRRKAREDGLMWDLFCDPILNSLDLNHVFIELPYQFSHQRPVKTEHIRYFDAITYTSVIQRKLGLANHEFTETEAEQVTKLENKMEHVFDYSIDFRGLVRDSLSERRSKKWLYERLLDHIEPEIVVLVASAFWRTFIEVCQERDISVVELQHGAGHHDHLGYSFPESASVSAFPDYIFVFGRFWKETVQYPIANEAVYPVGYPYLEDELESYADTERRQQAVFSSQRTIGKKLSKCALAFSELDTGYDVVYNLHPKEYNRWREEYPWLVDSSIEIIDSDTPSMYQILSESEVHVGVYSTVVYEGLCFGLDTYLLEAPGVSRMQTLIDSGYVTTVSSASDLADQIATGDAEQSVDTEYFFEPNAIDNISDAFDEILAD